MLPILKGMTKGSTRASGRRNNFIMPVVTLALLFLIGQGFWLSRNTHLFTPFSVKRIECDHCARVGVVRDEHDSRIMKMCPVCFGVGYHSVRRFDDQDAICAACGGMGRLESSGIWRNCERCGSRGVYRLDEWETIVNVEVVEVETNNSIQQSTLDIQRSNEDEETNNGNDFSAPKPLTP